MSTKLSRLGAIALLIALITGMLAPSVTASAAPAQWQKDGAVACGEDGVWAKIKNDSGSHVSRSWNGWVKVNGSTVHTDGGTVDWNQWVQITWTPPDGTQGTVQVYIRISSGGQTLDSFSKSSNLDCVPDASASASVGACSWNPETGAQSPVTFTVTGAVIHAPSGDITTSGTALYLGPGHYEWPWEALPGYKGSGTLVFDVGDCTAPTQNTVEVKFDLTCRTDDHAWTAMVEANNDGVATVAPATSGSWPPDGRVEVTVDVVWSEGQPLTFHQVYILLRPDNCAPPPATCPSCDPPQRELIPPGGLRATVYSRGECTIICKQIGRPVVDSWLRLDGYEDATLYYRGQFYHLQSSIGLDGVTYWFADIDLVGEDNSYVFLKAGVDNPAYTDADRYPRDRLAQYVACSVWPGWQDTTQGGYALWRPGSNTSDWVEWLINPKEQGGGGFFPQTYAGVDQAIEWARQLRDSGKLLLPK